MRVVNVSSLDLTLGIRMLRRSPWLSAVAVVGMALAIAIGAAYFSIIGLALDTTLAVPDGDRVVSIQTRTIAGPRTGNIDGVPPADFAGWRDALTTLNDVGAFRDETRNLITPDGRTEVVKVAAIAAAGFRLMHATPLHGRTLVDDDERPGAAPVVVIGHEQWQRHFGGDADVIGTAVRLDDTAHTIVGVMPEGFLFPVRHQYWTPLQLAAAVTRRDQAPLLVFGRVGPSHSVAAAHAELEAIGERMASEFPQSHKDVRLYARPYTYTFIGVEGPAVQRVMRAFQLGAGLLLLIVAVNVAILVYARTATRTGEIVVRTALGASRGRVVSQLFVEALVLTATAAVLGLTIVAVAFAMIREWVKYAPHLDRIPYWFLPTLSWPAILYVVVLAVVAAAVIGVVPALKATGRAVLSRLQQFSDRGAGMRLGRVWTTLIVVQVAIAVAILPAALHNAREALGLALLAPAPAASDLLRGTLLTTPGASPEQAQSRFAEMTALTQHLEAEAGVTAVAFAQDFPGREGYATVDAEQHGQFLASSMHLATNLFDVLDVPILAGRRFTAADTQPGAASVIVDQTLAETLAPGRNVVGRRLRYLSQAGDGGIAFGPWLEIVGVVPAFSDAFSAPPPFSTRPPRVYHAAIAGQTALETLIVRVRGGDPRRLEPRVRAIAASVNPSLKVHNLGSVVDAWRYDQRAASIAAFVILAVTGSVLLLSAAGIYSMMSFTVASRRREIGIRAALGADARRVLAGIFGRAITQLSGGVLVGLAIAAGLESLSGGTMMAGHGPVLLPAVIAMMFTVGLLATLGPARRGLAVQPTEALRAE